MRLDTMWHTFPPRLDGEFIPTDRLERHYFDHFCRFRRNREKLLKNAREADSGRTPSQNPVQDDFRPARFSEKITPKTSFSTFLTVFVSFSALVPHVT